MFKMKQKLASVLFAALTALVCTVMAFVALFTPVQTTAFAEETAWTLVTDASTLAEGDKVVIVAKDYNYALSTTQNGNNRGQAAVTKGDGVVTFGDDVQVLTLEAGTQDNTFAFNTGSGYLYAASKSSNYLRTETTLSNNSSWTITIADGVATIVAQGTNTRNTMQYNQGSSIFSCYSTSQKAICLYKKPGCAHENTTTVTTQAATCTQAGVETVACNDCDYSYTQSTPILEHSYNSAVTPPTETEQGYTTYTCKDCGYSYKDDFLPALGAETCTVTYSALQNVVSTSEVAAGTSVVLPACTVTEEGYTFVGWTLEQNVNHEAAAPDYFLASAEYTVTQDITFYALYSFVETSDFYQKVTSAPQDWSGEYLIVYESGSEAYIFNSTDAANGYLKANIETNGILKSDEVYAERVTIVSMTGGYSILTKNGYIYGSSSGNKLSFNTSSPQLNTIEIGENNTIQITSGRILQFNADSNQMRFRYYTSGNQKSIYLYALGATTYYLTALCEHTNKTTSEVIDPTCTEAGSSTETCSDCGKVFTTVIPATGHTETTQTTDPTCTQAGEIITTCSVCDEEIRREEGEAALGHTDDKNYSYQTNDDKTHAKTSACTVCGDAISIDENCSFGEGVVTDPTETAQGYTTYTCKDCGYFYQDDFSPVVGAEVHTLSYVVPQGITAVPEEEVAEGGTTELPSADGKGKYKFIGWTTASYAENTVAPETVYPAGTEYEVTQDVTLYALYSYTVGSGNYEKITGNLTDWSGTYLIVYEGEDGAYIFDGSLDKLDAVNDYKSATIADNAIADTEEIKGSIFTIASVEGGYSIQSASGYYIGQTSNANGLASSVDTVYTNTISHNGESVDIVSGGAYLRFNSASNQMRFRYYKSSSYTGQKAIQLYKLDAVVNYLTPSDLTADIKSGSITAGADFTMNYYVNLSAEFANSKMKFTFDNEEFIVEGEYDEAKGKYKFSLPNLAPQCMTLNIKAELLSANGELLDEIAEYSIKTNIQNLLNDNPSDELKQLLTDMLYYGAAAQKYRNVDVNNLATTDVNNIGTPSSEVPGSTDFTLVKNPEIQRYSAYFESAGVWFDNVNKLFVKLSTTENVTLTINGVEVEVNDVYVYTDGILATGFNETYTFELYHDDGTGKKLMQTLTYSVNAYAYAMQNDAEMGELAIALYRYGLSAAAYNS